MDSPNCRSEEKQYLIIGGSVAGLSAAIRLSELNKKVTLLDAGTIPCNKICGEFISPECHSILDRWGIGLFADIPSLTLYTKTQQLDYAFPRSAKSTTRMKLEQALLDKAIRMGVEVILNTAVDSIVHPENDDNTFTINTTHGKAFYPNRLIIAAGKFYTTKNISPRPKAKFVGIKAHLTFQMKEPKLLMYTFANGYIGMVPVAENVVNIACLVSAEEYDTHDNLEGFLNHLIKLYPNSELSRSLSDNPFVASDWLTARIPNFGQKTLPKWRDVFFVGDAAASLYPATGDGLASAITSGEMVGDYAAYQSAEQYHKAWRKTYLKRITWGKRLHTLLKTPCLTNAGLTASRLLPFIPKCIFNNTRG